MANRVFIGFGTNLGDRLENLRLARQGLFSAARVLRASSVYETAPWGFTDQPAFLNQVVEVETDLFPIDLLLALKRQEVEMGRQPTFRYGPRQIDMDILFYNDLCIDLDGLVIPHPRLAERAFVLVPLVELAPDFVHPLLKMTLRDLLSQIDRSGVDLFQENSVN